MIRRQLILDLNDELIVDNFAGGGGASTGIEMGLFRHVGRLQEIKLTNKAQIRMCGNSVCPPVAAAIVRTNVPELAMHEPVGMEAAG